MYQDVDAEDPRRWQDEESSAVYIFRGPRGRYEIVPEHIAAQAFDHFWSAGISAECALEMTRRYLRLCHAELELSLEVRTIRGGSQGDWADVFAAVAPDNGTPAGHIEQRRLWYFGHVWAVIPDGRAGVNGIYAEDPAAAVKHFRENFEDTYFDIPLMLRLRANSQGQAEQLAHQLVETWRGIDLPYGCKLSTAPSATSAQAQ